ncbi:hypothetical protein SELMODRAFT_431516 [Selaginella moellendorffii]|uniref:Uncharacterized protein n=1 Tax=Selaginella moellendorffii TaxID=88036 RepID=D8TCX3_SELML|nr:hypothetical protein SELMODRAFT_431516 [Selaginella moellendorffii]
MCISKVQAMMWSNLLEVCKQCLHLRNGATPPQNPGSRSSNHVGWESGGCQQFVGILEAGTLIYNLLQKVISGLAQWGEADPEEAHRDPLEICFASPKANNFYEWVSTIQSIG